MALQGTLDTFALADLVQLLASTGKTGELAITGDRGRGSLWFADGALVAGEPGGGSVDALFELLRFKDGSFQFDADVAPTEGHDPEDALEALESAQERMDVWAPIEELVPSPHVALHLSPELHGDEVTLDRARWGQLVAIAGGTTAGGFALQVGLSEFDAGVTIKSLVDDGLVTVDPDAAPGEGLDAPVTTDEVEADGAGTEPAAFEPVAVDEVAPEPFDADTSFDTDGSFETDASFDPEASFAAEPATFEGGTEAEAEGSLLVDLDTHLGGGAEGHSYLAADDQAADVLPEPLPGEGAAPDAWIEPLPEAESDPAAADARSWAAGDDDLATQLEALSPAAAAAVAAAAADSGAEEGTEEGRRVLRRIISKG